MSDIRTVDSDLEDIRDRDRLSAETWFKLPAIGACGRAFIDRRWLLRLLDTIIAEDQKMENPFDKPTVSSISDQRVVNNVMRHEYRVLSEIEKARMQRVKDLGLAFITELRNMLAERYPDSDVSTFRPVNFTWELQNSHKAMEEAVMWAVKHITQ